MFDQTVPLCIRRNFVIWNCNNLNECLSCPWRVTWFSFIGILSWNHAELNSRCDAQMILTQRLDFNCLKYLLHVFPFPCAALPLLTDSNSIVVCVLDKSVALHVPVPRLLWYILSVLEMKCAE